MFKKYKAIFFDWDGTAVLSRNAPVDEIIAAMKQLLEKEIRLVIVSGTTYENIAGGKLHEYFSSDELANLYLGLGRGAYNYQFEQGKRQTFSDNLPKDQSELLLIHQICFEIHQSLLRDYGIASDIVFSRPNYCKIDILVNQDRGEQLFFQGEDLQKVLALLEKHQFAGSLADLLAYCQQISVKQGLPLKITSDAKYLEVGLSDKSDNVDSILQRLNEKAITAADCSFWGDEFVEYADGLFGSDSYMQTTKAAAGDFFDVSDAVGQRPKGVQVLGGGVPTFLSFFARTN
ncbi:HAD family hydrolase [Enterococcus sp. LJL120]